MLTYGCISTKFCFSKSANTGKKASSRRSDTWSEHPAVMSVYVCVYVCVFTDSQSRGKAFFVAISAVFV